jgi:membrane-associated protease RseP (regulator of RpoE activity)
MKRAFSISVTLAGVLLPALFAWAQEPAKELSAPDSPAQGPSSIDVAPVEAQYRDDLNLYFSRLHLADEINRLSDFDAELTLLHANALGVDVAVPEPSLRAQLNLAEREGVTVTQVPDDSVGGKAGLQVHDIIVQIGDHGVGQIDDLNQALDAAAGKRVKIKLWRAGKQTEVEATPKKPEFARLKLANILISDLDKHVLAAADHFRIGVTLSEADDTLRQQLRLAAGEGLVVTDVVADSAAAQAGIQVHDVLTMLDGKRLTTVEAINAQIQELKDKSVELRLLRGGKEVTMQIAARKTQEAAFADKPLVYWNTKSCQKCHVAEASHQALGLKLGADKSVWTDGHHTRLWLYDKAFEAQAQAALLEAPAPSAPQQQIETLKEQLAEIQKTLAALELAISKPADDAKPEEKKEK